MKKTFIKITTIVMISILCLSTMACKNTINTYEKGLEITVLMEKLVKDEELKQCIDASIDLSKVIANDYDTPTRVYKIELPTLEQLKNATLKIAKIEEKYNQLSEEAKEHLNKMISIDLLLARTNDYYEWEDSIIVHQYQVTRYYKKAIEKPIAYLYIFETGTPIVVDFQTIENQTRAKGTFFLNKNINSLSEVREIFEKYGCTVTDYKIN